MSYQGPLNIFSTGAKWGVSTRALLADSGAEAIVCRRSGAADQTFSCDTNNAVDAPAVTAFVTGGENDGGVAIWKDQVGSLHAETPSHQNNWTESAQGGKPSIFCPQMQSVATVSLASGSATAFIVVKAKEFGTATVYFSNGNTYLDFSVGASSYLDSRDSEGNAAGGQYGGLLTPDVTYLIVATMEFGNNSFTYDGTTAPENNDNDQNGPVGALNNLTVLVDGTLQEALVYEGILSQQDRDSVAANIAAYHGTA